MSGDRKKPPHLRLIPQPEEEASQEVRVPEPAAPKTIKEAFNALAEGRHSFGDKMESCLSAIPHPEVEGALYARLINACDDAFTTALAGIRGTRLTTQQAALVVEQSVGCAAKLATAAASHGCQEHCRERAARAAQIAYLNDSLVFAAMSTFPHPSELGREGFDPEDRPEEHLAIEVIENSRSGK